MKKLIASLLVFTIGVGANGLYCSAVTEPTEKVDAKVTQTAANGNSEKTTSEENDKNKVDEQKDNKSQSEENKNDAISQQKLKELVKKEEDKEKLKKGIIADLRLAILPIGLVFMAVWTTFASPAFAVRALCRIGKLIIM